MKIPSVQQIRAADQFTIENEPISSLDLMERASKVFCEYFKEYIDKDKAIAICCGKGNNGGDGLAVARLLSNEGYSVEVFILNYSNNSSPDFELNFKRLKDIRVNQIKEGDTLPLLSRYDYIVDALWGSGLKREIIGYNELFINAINNSTAKVISIDIPSGLHADQHLDSIKIKADKCLSFEFPKLSFFLPQNEKYLNNWRVKSIGLSKDFIDSLDCHSFFANKDFVKNIYKKRTKFSHKGTYGHACMISGQKGMLGACILASKAALKGGLGLLTTYIPECAYDVIQKTLPEAMVITDKNANFIANYDNEINGFKYIGIGPGLGKAKESSTFLNSLLSQSKAKKVIDADAINLIASDKKLLNMLDENCLLTPHPGEFKRLVGSWDNDYDKLDKQRAFCKKHNCYMLLKGAYSSSCDINGNIYFNDTGNPGMATAGSGDVLTGLILALLAQEYNLIEASVLGAYIHGMAADLAMNKESQESLISSDIISYFGKAFKTLH